MATKSQNLTFDERIIEEVKELAIHECRSKSAMFNLLIKEALEARGILND